MYLNIAIGGVISQIYLLSMVNRIDYMWLMEGSRKKVQVIEDLLKMSLIIIAPLLDNGYKDRGRVIYLDTSS